MNCIWSIRIFLICFMLCALASVMRTRNVAVESGTSSSVQQPAHGQEPYHPAAKETAHVNVSGHRNCGDVEDPSTLLRANPMQPFFLSQVTRAGVRYVEIRGRDTPTCCKRSEKCETASKRWRRGRGLMLG